MGELQLAYWTEVTPGCNTSGKRAGLLGQGTVVGVGPVEEGIGDKVVAVDGVKQQLISWLGGVFPIRVLLQQGHQLLLAVLGRAGHV